MKGDHIMKLSRAQIEVLEDAKRQIREARELDYPEWLKATDSTYQIDTEYWREAFRKAVNEGKCKEHWEMRRRGEALTYCNSRTLRKLQSLGLIEILRDSTGETTGVDIIKVKEDMA